MDSASSDEPTPLVHRLRPRRNRSLSGASSVIETGDEGGDEEEAPSECEFEVQGSPESSRSRTTRSGKTFGTMDLRKSQLRQEAMDDPDMEVDDTEDEDAVTGA